MRRTNPFPVPDDPRYICEALRAAREAAPDAALVLVSGGEIERQAPRIEEEPELPTDVVFAMRLRGITQAQIERLQPTLAGVTSRRGHFVGVIPVLEPSGEQAAVAVIGRESPHADGRPTMVEDEDVRPTWVTASTEETAERPRRRTLPSVTPGPRRATLDQLEGRERATMPGRDPAGESTFVGYLKRLTAI